MSPSRPMPLLDLPTAVLDHDHLDRQTFGDRALARDLLALFDGQCERLLPVITGGAATRERAEAAHALLGAARAVGASRVAGLAERLERDLLGPEEPTDGPALSSLLAAATDEVRAVLRAHLAGQDPGRNSLAKPKRVA